VNTHPVLPATNPKLPFDAAAFVPKTAIVAEVTTLVARAGLDSTRRMSRSSSPWRE
jgi:hypothetical protein